jgi:hypothetical protein
MNMNLQLSISRIENEKGEIFKIPGKWGTENNEGSSKEERRTASCKSDYDFELPSCLR